MSNNKFTQDGNKVNVVKTIFKLCIETCGISKIAKYLNEEKVPVFGTSEIWYQSYVKKILFNRSVLGEFQPHMLIDGKRKAVGEIVSNYFPQIIDEETFLLAHAAISRRRIGGRGRKGTSFTNIFSGFIYCGKCGSKMALRNRGNKTKTKTLICTKKREGAACTMPEWAIGIVEKMVVEHLKEVDFHSLLNNEESRISALTSQIEVLDEKIKLKEQEAERATDALVAHDLSSIAKVRVTSKLNEVSLELQELKERLFASKIELQSAESNNSAMQSTQLKQLLEQIELKTGDYNFRSSLHQVLTKQISKIVLHESGGSAACMWELEESSSEVVSFRQSGSLIAKVELSKLINRREFLKYVSQYDRRISIHYSTGDVRNIIGGDNISMLNSKLRKK